MDNGIMMDMSPEAVRAKEEFLVKVGKETQKRVDELMAEGKGMEEILSLLV